MNISVEYRGGGVPVTVHRRLPINDVIDILRNLDKPSFEKAVRSARWLRFFDKSIKWIEGKFYEKR